MSNLYRLLYCSRNMIDGTADTVAAEIRALLVKARANNDRDGLSGALLFSTGFFAQVLEGPLPMVERAFERIQCDDRHSDVTVLQAGPIDARDFPDWSMGFLGTNDHPLAAVTIGGAFEGEPKAGGALLRVLRDVVVQEDAWATA